MSPSKVRSTSYSSNSGRILSNPRSFSDPISSCWPLCIISVISSFDLRNCLRKMLMLRLLFPSNSVICGKEMLINYPYLSSLCYLNSLHCPSSSFFRAWANHFLWVWKILASSADKRVLPSRPSLFQPLDYAADYQRPLSRHLFCLQFCCEEFCSSWVSSSLHEALVCLAGVEELEIAYRSDRRMSWVCW